MSDGSAVALEQGAPTAAPDMNSQGTQVSWRDRHENDPASRRFSAVHRRAVTEG